MPKLYTTPGGHWSGTAADWKAAMKLENAKADIAACTVEFPGDKPGLIATLNAKGWTWSGQPATVGHAASDLPPPPPPEGGTTVTAGSLDEMFASAPITQQLDLAVGAIDRAGTRLRTVTTYAPVAAVVTAQAEGDDLPPPPPEDDDDTMLPPPPPEDDDDLPPPPPED